jgi:uncharacterized protein YjdB
LALSVTGRNQQNNGGQNESTRVIARRFPSTAQNRALSWTSSDTNVVAFHIEGNNRAVGSIPNHAVGLADPDIAPMGPGTATIRIATTDGSNFSHEIKVTVVKRDLENFDLGTARTGDAITEGTIAFVGGSISLFARATPRNAYDPRIVYTADNPEIATVTFGGPDIGTNRGTVAATIIGLSPGTAIITATSIDKPSLSHTFTVTVEDGEFPATICEPSDLTEVFSKAEFKSDGVWTVGNLVWSDVVVIKDVEKDIDDFEGATGGGMEPFGGGPKYNYADFATGEHGDYFSWCALRQYGDLLCPDNWRVPTSADFQAMDVFFGRPGQNRYATSIGYDRTVLDDMNATIAKYQRDWGLRDSSGRLVEVAAMFGLGPIDYFNQQDLGNTYYWAMNMTGQPTDPGFASAGYTVFSLARIEPIQSTMISSGMILRCVRDAELAELKLDEVTPNDEATNVEITESTPVTATFSRDIFMGNRTAFENISLKTGETGVKTGATFEGDELTITHSGFAYLTEYTVTIPANALFGYDKAISWTFKTKPDPATPIAKIVTEQNIAIFPNPTVDVLRIQSQQPVLRVGIYNVQGQLLRQMSGNITELTVSDLTVGTYLLQVTTAQGTVTQRFVKQ